MLLTVASGVILMMLLVVVPQFEVLFEGNHAKLPFATQMVMGASEGVRSYGLVGLGAIVAVGLAVRQWLRRPGARLAFDRAILRFPQLGPLIVNAETAAFARTLGQPGGGRRAPAHGPGHRPAQRRQHPYVRGHRQGGLGPEGGRRPLRPPGRQRRLPAHALSFLRTGEETARLGLMLGRLADVLDRTVRSTIQR